MAGTPPALSLLLLLNLLSSIISLAEKYLLSLLSSNSSLLRLVRNLILSSFLFLLRIFPSHPYTKPAKSENYSGGEDSAVARALSQLLSIMNSISVSSRKYEIVLLLVERIIEDNLLEDSEVLREINCKVLCSAFDRTLSQLESAMLDRGKDPNCNGTPNEDVNTLKAGRFMRAVQYFGDVAWARFGASTGLGDSVEKLAAEVLWLAQKMAACQCVEEAVAKWALAKQVAWLALSAEPRLQCSLVKVSAFLLKHTKNLGAETEQHRQTKTRMLLSWIPLLCRASNGTDTPVMSTSERTELERVLEDIIETLDQEEEQEMVLSLWLHHFTYSPSSDWPNLQPCYERWCAASRKSLLLQSKG